MTVVALATKKTTVAPVALAASSACASIAPSWPLDQMIAVNPYWQQKHLPFREVSAKLAALNGIESVMPHHHWLDLYRKGQISDQALDICLRRYQVDQPVEACIAALECPPARPTQWQTLAALFDLHRDESQMLWREEVLYQTSQYCAAYFQSDSPIERVDDESPANALYRSWRNAITRDAGISIVMGTRSLKHIVNELPDSVDGLLHAAVDTLELEDARLEDYFQSLLLSINGWASHIAYRCWHQPTDEMQGLLAIALAWELVIWNYTHAHLPVIAERVRLRWRSEQLQLPKKIQQHYAYETLLWVCFAAYEHQQQQRMQAMLLSGNALTTAPEPEVQALFCIDVRSEVMRRAFEAQSRAIQTIGFAGFFGMPIQYHPHGTEFSRPQLPGLITTGIHASARQTSAKRLRSSQHSAIWKNWSQSPIGAFSMVEASGWWYAFSMLKKMWLPSASENPLNRLSHYHEWTLSENGANLDLDRCTELAAGALRTIGLKRYAPTVLLIGHASETTNNLHAAGLDCGACGGQSGEVNVRVLAALLNHREIRRKLNDQGFNIAANTRFIAGLHNTTTDDLICFDDDLPAKLQNWLRGARTQAQAERERHFPEAPQIDSIKQRDRRFQRRARDWSQVRPEWGLAGNGAFVIAPRSWTQELDLEGRCFLHDYVWQNDRDSSILEQLMTAPMIVTNWINMQYNASVSDNRKFGSGNKILHNAVGENLGVFEGNSGDLRIGLSRQSLHNGKDWMHLPERLSVYIGAPCEDIARIVHKHHMLQELIDNDWLYLFSWNKKGCIERYHRGSWHHSAGFSM